MAPHLSDYIGVLRSLALSARRLDHLLQEHDDLRDGSGLYAYHVLPSILADLKAMGVHSEELHQAKAQADLRWSFLDDEQQAYWEKQTCKLWTGSLLPLDPSTYSNVFTGQLTSESDRSSGTDHSGDFSQAATTPFKFLHRSARVSVHEATEDDISTPSRPSSPSSLEKTQTAEANEVLRRLPVDSERSDEPLASLPPPVTPEAVKTLSGALGISVTEAKDTPHFWAAGKAKITKTSSTPVATPKTQLKPPNVPVSVAVQWNEDDNAVLYFLSGQEMHKPNPDDYGVVVSTVLAAIRQCLNKDGGLVLQGRVGGTRMDLHPDASDVTSIKARLLSAVARGKWIDAEQRKTWGVTATMAFMVRPLVAWNYDSIAFSDFACPFSKAMHAPDPAEQFVSRYTWLQRHANQIGPVTYDRRTTVVMTIMQLLRERAAWLCPDPDLIKKTPAWIMINGLRNRGCDSRAGKFGLVNKDQGFAKQLRACFERSQLAPYEYEDLIEQKLFRLHRKFPKLELTEG